MDGTSAAESRSSMCHCIAAPKALRHPKHTVPRDCLEAASLGIPSLSLGVHAATAFRALAHLLLREVWIVLDFTDLLDVALGMRGDFQHPLPAIDDLFVSEAVRTQVVVRSLDVIDHSGAQD
jgi:hypothetical protein